MEDERETFRGICDALKLPVSDALLEQVVPLAAAIQDFRFEQEASTRKASDGVSRTTFFIALGMADSRSSSMAARLHRIDN